MGALPPPALSGEREEGQDLGAGRDALPRPEVHKKSFPSAPG